MAIQRKGLSMVLVILLWISFGQGFVFPRSASFHCSTTCHQGWATLSQTVMLGSAGNVSKKVWLPSIFFTKDTSCTLNAQKEIQNCQDPNEDDFRLDRQLALPLEKIVATLKRTIFFFCLTSVIFFSPVNAKGGGRGGGGGRGHYSSHHSTRVSPSSSSAHRSSSSAPQTRRSASSGQHSSSSHLSSSQRQQSPSPQSHNSSRGNRSSSSPRSAANKSSRHASMPSQVYKSPKKSNTSSSSPPPPVLSTKANKTSRKGVKVTRLRSWGHVGGRAQRGTRKPTVPPTLHTPRPPGTRDGFFYSSPTPSSRWIHFHHNRGVHVHPRQPTVVVDPSPVLVDPFPSSESTSVSSLKPIQLPSQMTVAPIVQEVNTEVQNSHVPVVEARLNPWPDRLLGASVGLYAATVIGKTIKENKDQNANEVLPLLLNSVRDSGTYIGVTCESDGMVQQVRVDLEFCPNGLVSGRGEDEEDGLYTITNGLWSGSQVQWTEQYDGYFVNVKGQLKRRNHNAKAQHGELFLDCSFVSSIDNISGTFELTKR